MPLEAHYHTLHEGVNAVAEDLVHSNTDIKGMKMELTLVAQQVQLAVGKLTALELELDSLCLAGGSQVIAALQWDLADAKGG